MAFAAAFLVMSITLVFGTLVGIAIYEAGKTMEESEDENIK